MYLCVADWDATTKVVTAENRAPDEPAAMAIIATMQKEGYTEAFYVLTPTGPSKYWVVDPVAKTVSYDQATNLADALAVGKIRKYQDADAEYVARSLTAAEGVTPGLGKVRGSSPQDRLAALFVKANAAGNTPLANALAAVHEKLDTLKDAIEAAADATALDAIDVTANTHWA